MDLEMQIIFIRHNPVEIKTDIFHLGVVVLEFPAHALKIEFRKNAEFLHLFSLKFEIYLMNGWSLTFQKLLTPIVLPPVEK